MSIEIPVLHNAKMSKKHIDLYSCNRDNKRYFMDQIQLLFIFAYFVYLAGNRIRYTNCITNAHYQIVCKGHDADILLEGN